MLTMRMDHNYTGCEDGTGSGSCPMKNFCISGVEPSSSAVESRSMCTACAILFLSLFRAPQLSRDVPAYADFLCGKLLCSVPR